MGFFGSKKKTEIPVFRTPPYLEGCLRELSLMIGSGYEITGPDKDKYMQAIKDAIDAIALGKEIDRVISAEYRE